MKVPSCNNLCGILLNCSPEQRAGVLLKRLPISCSHFFFFWWKGFLAHLIFHIFRPENSQRKKMYFSLFVFNLYHRVSDAVNGLIKLWLTVVVLTCHIKCFYWIPRPMTGACSLTSNDREQFTTAGTFYKFTEGIRTNNVTFFPGESSQSDFPTNMHLFPWWESHELLHVLQSIIRRMGPTWSNPANTFVFFLKWYHLYEIREKSPATRGKTGGRVIINLESDFMINSHNLNLRLRKMRNGRIFQLHFYSQNWEYKFKFNQKARTDNQDLKKIIKIIIQEPKKGRHSKIKVKSLNWQTYYSETLFLSQIGIKKSDFSLDCSFSEMKILFQASIFGV